MWGGVFWSIFLGGGSTKSRYTIENALKCEHGSWTWIHGRWFPSGNHAHDVMLRCWISWVVTNSMKNLSILDQSEDLVDMVGLRSYSMHCNSYSPGCMRRWENFWEMGRQQIMAGEWDSEILCNELPRWIWMNFCFFVSGYIKEIKIDLHRFYERFEF